MKRSRSGSGITLRDRDRQSSLTIHVCFLRETVFVGTNHPNMEETGSLENPIPSGKCYLDLNRALPNLISKVQLDEHYNWDRVARAILDMARGARSAECSRSHSREHLGAQP